MVRCGEGNDRRAHHETDRGDGRGGTGYVGGEVSTGSVEKADGSCGSDGQCVKVT
jgi:hypothetical protein